jgi:CelD/BcsL family acetyltransferase involved in cellulose biosynthesis
MIKIEYYESFTSLPISSSDWNQLVSGSSTIFQTYEWLKIWHDMYIPDEKILLLLAFENDTLLGIAPLRIIHLRYLKTINIRKVIFLGERVSDYCDFITIPGKENEIINAFIDFLFNSSFIFDWIDFRDILNSSGTMKVLKDENRYEVKVEKDSRYFSINTLQRKDIYLKNFSAKTLQSFRRKQNNLQKNFTVNYNHCDPDSENAFKYLLKYNIERMEQNNKISYFKNKSNVKFIKEIINAFLGRGWLKFSTLRLDDDISSVFLYFKFKDRLYYWISGYDISLNRYTLGSLHLRSLIDYCFENKYSRFDFLRGEDSYKLKWHPECEYSQRIIILKKDIKKEVLRFNFELAAKVFK